MNEKGKNGPFSRHWTESDTRVVEFLENTFKDSPIRPDWKAGYDYMVGDAKIEVKSCVQWFPTSEGSNGKRRRGRFHFDRGVDADIILFVLVKESEDMEFAIRFPEQFGVKTLDKTKIISWNKVFTDIN